MPIYEYRCRKCKQEFERIVFSQQDEAKCPSCQSSRTERLLSSFAVGNGVSVSEGCKTPDACRSGQFR